MNISEEFNKVRDIPYRIPLTLDKPDHCCTGKAEMLVNIFTTAGYNARYRVGICRWIDLHLPTEIQNIPHDDNTSHTFCEININGEWKVVDATWDKGLQETFDVNEWDEKSDMKLAFPNQEILSPEKSREYLNYISTKESIIADLKVNRVFYKAINEWLERCRH